MDGELITAIAATAVSVAATGYAARQTYIAKGAARSAEEQARSAEAQAQAAEDQVALMRRQLSGEERARHEARGPNFSASFRTARHDPALGRKVAVIKLQQEDGPGLTSVQVGVHGEGVVGLFLPPEVISPDEPGTELGPMAPAGTKDVRVVLESSASSQGTEVTLSLRCADGTGEPWRRDYSCKIPRPSRVRGF